MICFNIDDTLVGGAAKFKTNIFEVFDEWSVNEYINVLKYFVVFDVFVKITCVNPDIFVGIEGFNFFTELSNCGEIFGFERVSSENGQSLYIREGYLR